MRPTTATAFLDALFIIVLALAVALWLLIRHVNPPETGGDPSPGTIVVEVKWPDDLNVDVDLWVRGPGDRPVGYSRLSGYVWNLLRDDLGYMRDPIGLNYENAYTRGSPDGEYVINVHMYANRTSVWPVPVTVGVWMRNEFRRIDIALKKVDLNHNGEEITVIRFRIEDGKLVPGSLHNAQEILRMYSH